MITHDLATRLQALAVGTVGTDIFEGFFPDSPTKCIAIFQAGGRPPEVVRTSPALEYPEAHIIVRGATYSEAEEWANDVMIALHTDWEATINGHRYLYIKAHSSPFFLRYDYSANPPHCYFAVDFAIVKEVE